ncbi:unnamed protein product [Protopolystoma xenopodis]|uniref:Uncharacterized protein n=1 Tax=Protopolystoma xenopodis TaxID=117903 RepID=A0A448X7H9_9PLAT|nr:unnamed protein product [Protopolystoma xenopodis]
MNTSSNHQRWLFRHSHRPHRPASRPVCGLIDVPSTDRPSRSLVQQEPRLPHSRRHTRRFTRVPPLRLPRLSRPRRVGQFVRPDNHSLVDLT